MAAAVAPARPIGATNVPAKATYVDSEERADERPSLRELLAPEFRRDTVALWIAFFACLHTFYLSINWIPSMLTGAGFSPCIASAGVMAFNLGGAAGAIAGAAAMSRFGSKTIMLGMGAGTVIGALTLRSIEIGPTFDTTLLFGLLLVTGGLLNALQITLYALAAHIYPTVVRATGVGSAASVGRIGRAPEHLRRRLGSQSARPQRLLHRLRRSGCCNHGGACPGWSAYPADGVADCGVSVYIHS